MSSEDKIDTFSIYNMSISKIKMANLEYSEASKEICELAVLNILQSIYHIKDVYERVLTYMQENDLYERFLKSILELQFNPPQSQEDSQSNEKSSDCGESDTKEKKQSQDGGGVKTKVDKFKEISKDFIDDMFRIDDDNL